MKQFGGICAVCGKSFRFLVTHLRTHQIRPRFGCRKCPKDFSTKADRKIHENNHVGIKRNLTPKCCAVCGRLLANKTDVARHIRSVHVESRNFSCGRCPRTFKLEEHLAVHLRRHTDNKPFACQLCPSRFYTARELQFHAIVQSDEKLVRCKSCGKRLASSRSLGIHMRIHRRDFCYSCVSCPAKFTDSSAWNRHAKVHIGQRDFACPHCSASFLNKSILGKHLHVHDADNASDFTCNLCNVGFSKETELERHTIVIHANSKPEPVHRKRNFFPKSILPDSYPCPVCSLMFPNHFIRNRHFESTHSNSASWKFNCAVCQGKFMGKPALAVHLLRHRSQANHSGEHLPRKQIRLIQSIGKVWCAVCGGNFADQRYLTTHLLCKHAPACCQKIKPLPAKIRHFECEYCTAICTTRRLLKIHRRIHTNEKPYACAQCPRKYAQKGNLVVHVRNHLRAHGFACEICPQTFYSKRQLDSHLLIHGGAGIVRFGCAVCGSYHGLRDSLISHLTLRHRTEPRPFSCDICPKRFMTQKGLAKHYAKKAHTWLLRSERHKRPR